MTTQILDSDFSIIVPLSIVDSQLVSSTIAEPTAGDTPDPAAWSAASGYNQGQYVSRIAANQHQIWYCKVTHVATATLPENDSANWQFAYSTNRWRMHDTINETQSSNTNSIINQYALGKVANACVLDNIDLNSAQVTTYANPATSVILQPFDLSNAAWTKALATITTNAVAAPDGTVTADKLVEDNTNGTHLFTQSAALVGTLGSQVTISIYAMAGERDEFVLQLDDASFIGAGAAMAVVFNLTAKTGTSLGAAGISNIIVTDAGFGWFRCSFTCTAAAAYSTIDFKVNLRSGGLGAYLGDNASGMYFWGGQSDNGSVVTGGLTYSKLIKTKTRSYAKLGMYEFLFNTFRFKKTAVFMNLPPMTTNITTLVATKTGDVAKIGTTVFGKRRVFGGVKYGASAGIKDYSSRTTDSFGNTTVVQHSYSKIATLAVLVPNDMIEALHQMLADYRAIPVCWLGTGNMYDPFVIIGFYNTYEVIVEYTNYSLVNIQIESLI